MYCFCKQELKNDALTAEKIVFEDGIMHCQVIKVLELFDIISSFILFGIVAFTNICHEILFNWLSAFHRPSDTTLRNFYKTFTIFIVQYLNTAILFIVAYSSFLSSKK